MVLVSVSAVSPTAHYWFALKLVGLLLCTVLLVVILLTCLGKGMLTVSLTSVGTWH